MTIVVIAHWLSTIRNADKIIVFDKGNIAEEGSHDELISKNGVYAKLVKKQSEVEQIDKQHDENDLNVVKFKHGDVDKEEEEKSRI